MHQYQINKQEVITSQQFLSSFNNLKFLFHNPCWSLIISQYHMNMEDPHILKVMPFRTDKKMESVPSRFRVIMLVNNPLFIDLIRSEKCGFGSVNINLVWRKDINLTVMWGFGHVEQKMLDPN